MDKFATRLNGISKSFCAAKWTQLTLYLQTGQNHSCHHPALHKILLPELETNPKALHNTRHKKLQRKLMLEGIRPSECEYCWAIEDSTPGEALSDRYRKSAAPWSEPYLDEIAALDWTADYNPKYVEVSFSNKCNFKCSYCGPVNSSKWLEESRKFGPYPTSGKHHDPRELEESNAVPYLESEENPYVKAFWKWWPDLYEGLHSFRITGGEPLLHNETFRVLDHLIAHPNPGLEFALNSNLCPPEKLFSRFLEYAPKLCDPKLLKKFTLYTSIESWGEQAEYSRFGLDFELFISNLRRLSKEFPHLEVTVMSTFNILSLPKFHLLLEELAKLKRQSKLNLSLPFLRYPRHQAVNILTPKHLKKIDAIALRMRDLKAFSPSEIEEVTRMRAWAKTAPVYHILDVLRYDFYRFFKEYDRRKGTSFLKTFPELEDFWEICTKRPVKALYRKSDP